MASDNFETHVDQLPYAHGGSVGVGRLRVKPEDFIVNETLTFEPSGEGEHIFLYIKKTGLNTDDVVKKLSIHAGVPRRSISYAGMKDRQAVTQQWFSVQMPGQEGPDWSLLNDESLNIEKVTRHLRKLKRGVIKYNAFEIILSQIKFDASEIESRVSSIKQRGVPNYFMAQRFGYAGQNLSRAYGFFERNEAIKNKKMKSLFLSSSRSFLFNKVLSERVFCGSWDKVVMGDAFMLDGTRQFFHEDTQSSDITKRLLDHDIHPTGPLFGKGRPDVTDDTKEAEEAVFLENAVFCDGLIKNNVDASRRSLRVVPTDLTVDRVSDKQLRLTFKLPSGSYATAVIRELIDATVGL